jgi:hypothetical protein
MHYGIHEQTGTKAFEIDLYPRRLSIELFFFLQVKALAEALHTSC